MSRKRKDTDYLAISARVKAMETKLLTEERMEQLLTAGSEEEVMHILGECGYPEFSLKTPEDISTALAIGWREIMKDLWDNIPDTRYLDIFKLQYDYHNAKALIKANAMEADPQSMLFSLGCTPTAELRRFLDTNGEEGELPETLEKAVREAKEVFDRTGDPQLCDAVLDRWRYRNELEEAKESGSAFLYGYVQACVDSYNLRAIVRALLMGKSREFLDHIICEGGDIPRDPLLDASKGGRTEITQLYRSTRLEAAAETGDFTEFERLCDDAVNEYLAGSLTVPFGEAPLMAYLAARETEYTNLRIILMGRRAGLAPDTIRSRLRKVFI